jgi:hypothetical protein
LFYFLSRNVATFSGSRLPPELKPRKVAALLPHAQELIPVLRRRSLRADLTPQILFPSTTPPRFFCEIIYPDYKYGRRNY